MTKLLNIALCVVFLSSSFILPSQGFAHESSGKPLFNPYIQETEALKDLTEAMELILHDSEQYGSPVTEETKMAYTEKLLEVVYGEIQARYAELGDLSFFERFTFKEFADRFLNKAHIFDFIKNTYKKVGLKAAIGFAVSELLENLSYLTPMINLKLSYYLIPMAATHSFDALVYTSIYGIPEVIHRVKTYRRFGGPLKGIKAYYDFLVAQKEILPLDWSEVIDIKQFKIPHPETEAFVIVDLAILKKSKVERFLPKNVIKFLYPRRAAQRETSAALSVNEIAKIAKSIGIPVYIYKGLSEAPPIYSSVLLKEILQHDLGPSALFKYLEKNKMAQFVNQKIKENPMDAVRILTATSDKELSYLGESPTILAQRLAWYFNGQLDEIRESKETTSADFKELRAISKKIDKELLPLAENPDLQPEQPVIYFRKLFEVKEALVQKLQEFQSRPRICNAIIDVLKR